MSSFVGMRFNELHRPPVRQANSEAGFPNGECILENFTQRGVPTKSPWHCDCLEVN